MKTIFLCSANLLYISDLLRTEYIKYLSSKHRVVVFLPFSESEIKKLNYYENKNIKYICWNIQNKKFCIRMKLLRVSMIRQFDKITRIRKTMPLYLAGKNWKINFLFYFSVFVANVFRIKFTADFFTSLEKWLMPLSPNFHRYCNEYNPSLIITASPGFTNMEAEFIILAKKKKIPTAAIDFSWDNLSSNAPRIRKTNYLIVWSNAMEEEAIKIHNYKRKNIFVSGIIRYDYYFKSKDDLTKKEFLIKKNLNYELKTILISTVTLGAYDKFDLVIDKIIKWRDKGVINQNFNLFVRLHPKDSFKKYEKFVDIKGVHIEEAADNSTKIALSGFNVEMSKKDLLNLKYTLKYCDININHCSTITLEACIFNKPIINICLGKEYLRHYSSYHYKPISKSGAVRIAYNNDELIKYINLYLDNSRIDEENRKKIVKKYINFIDGLSYKRSVDFLDKILN